MNEIFSATAPCWPTGRPHWTRSADHSRAIFRHHFAADAQLAGMARRPVFRVLSAIRRPSPSRPSRFSTGTRTWWKRVTPFSRPFRPMKSLRFSTVTPSESVSTTNAVIPPLAPSCGGTWAITTTSSATTPFVVQSLTPSRVYADPSSVGTAVLPSRAGSEPTSGSVSRNAVTAPFAQRGRNRCFWSSVPNAFTGSGTPIDWCADSSAPMVGWIEPASISALP